LLAEEETETILDVKIIAFFYVLFCIFKQQTRFYYLIFKAERVFKQALKCADIAYKKSLHAQEQGHNLESLHSEMINF
jgi:hypothetical protein